ncbi:MAG: hypothetical protein M5U12_09335 [Verrucomicrobia bacterium]|nr:hypothetical protein [Verrucomicrobiota bacterium]
MALLALGLAASVYAGAPGCVAARGGICVLPNQLGILGSGEAAPPSPGFQVFFGYRWQHSDRHFLDPGVSHRFSPCFSNRERSVPDQQWTEATGIYRHGDAAFADYLVMFTLSKSPRPAPTARQVPPGTSTSFRPGNGRGPPPPPRPATRPVGRACSRSSG